MILNTLFGGGINRLSLEEFYNYIEYLQKIGISQEIIDIFEKIVSNTHNENPYQLLDCLTPYLGQSNKHVYSYTRKR